MISEDSINSLKKSTEETKPTKSTNPTEKPLTVTEKREKKEKKEETTQQPPAKRPKVSSLNEKPPKQQVIHHDFLRSNRSKLGITKQQLTSLKQQPSIAAKRNITSQQPTRKVTIPTIQTKSTTTGIQSRLALDAARKRTTTIGTSRLTSNPTTNRTADTRRSTLASNRPGITRRNTTIHPQKEDTKGNKVLEELASIKELVNEVKLQLNSKQGHLIVAKGTPRAATSVTTTNTASNTVVVSEEESLMNKKMIETLQSEKLKLLSENGQLEVTIGTLKSRQSALEMEVEQYKSVAKTRQAEIERISIEKTDALKKTSAAEQRISELETLFKSEKEQNTTLQTTLSARDASILEMKAKIDEYEMIRRRLHNEVQELKGNIRVFCRVRPPLSTLERRENSIFTYNDMDPGQIEVSEPTLSVRGEKQVRKYEFNYDRVFGPEATQDDIFEELSQLVQSALDGYSCCVFAYGQTGSGKTYTMEGPSSESGEALFAAESPERGIIPRAVEQIFTAVSRLRGCGWEYTIEVSFLEVYNEQLRDLLKESPQGQGQQQQMLQIVTNEDSVSVQGCRSVGVRAPNEVYTLLDVARKNRVVAETKYNEHSSRSHSVFRLHIRGHNSKRRETVTSVLNLVDLAGSERLDAGHNKAERQKETQNINKSLTNLRNVITALAESKKHVPYRESVLTRLLQNSLEKKAKMLMFVNVSPSIASVGQTLNALRFASTANKCHIGTVQRQAFNDK